MTLQTLARLIRRRLRNDWDILIAITGSEGVGKSTFAIQLSKLIDPRFNFQRNMSFYPDPKEVVREFNALRRYQVYVLDEAIRVMFKQEWQSKLQQTLVKMYATERWQNKATIICIPRFQDLSTHFRQYRVTLWCHLYERGHVFVYAKDEDKDINDVWHMDDAAKIKKTLFKKARSSGISLKDRYEFERRLPSYVTDFIFDDLDDETREAYRNQKINSRKDKFGEDEKLNNLEKKYRTAFKKLISSDLIVDKTTNIKLAQTTGIAASTIGKLRTTKDKLAKQKWRQL